MHKGGHAQALTPLAHEDIAVLENLVRGIERELRALDSAEGEAKTSLVREVNYKLALLTVSISLYATRGREQTGTLSAYADRLLKEVRRAKGLWALWEEVKRLLPWLN